tara:strand:+ start:138 stop:362 length:225 start_codon:yes stop_codon:yes gene_type:complete
MRVELEQEKPPRLRGLLSSLALNQGAFFFIGYNPSSPTSSTSDSLGRRLLPLLTQFVRKPTKWVLKKPKRGLCR